MRQIDFLPILEDTAFVDVDGKIFELEPARTALLGIEAGLAQVRGDPRQQLPGPRRLDHVVIGPDLETHHDIDLLAAAAHDHHRDAGILAADGAAEVEARAVREDHIQHHQARLLLVELAQSVRGGLRFDHLIAVLLAALAQLLAK